MSAHINLSLPLQTGSSLSDCLRLLRDQQIAFINLHELIICESQQLALLFKNRQLSQIIQL